MPSLPPLRLTPELLAEAERIAVGRERLRAASVDLGWLPALQKDARSRGAHAACTIAGLRITLQQVQTLDEGGEVPAASEEACAFARSALATQRWLQAHAAGTPVTPEALAALLDAVPRHAADGAHRWSVEQLSATLGPWQREFAALTPLLSAALLHWQIVATQSFGAASDGLARTLAQWERCHRGFDAHGLLVIDEYFAADLPRFRAVVERSTEADDGSAWLHYYAEATRATLESTLPRLQAAAGDASGRLALRPRQRQLLQVLADRGSLAPAEIWAELGVTRQGAIELLRPLIAAGLVERVGGAKSGHYVLRHAAAA